LTNVKLFPVVSFNLWAPSQSRLWFSKSNHDSVYPVQNKPFTVIFSFLLCITGVLLMPGCQDQSHWQQEAPQFPTYPSSHGTFAAAAAEVLTYEFGNNFIMADRCHE